MTSMQEKYKALLDDPNISSELRERIQSLVDVKNTQASVKKTNVRSSFNTNSGAQFFGKLDFVSACKREGDKVTPGKVTFTALDLKSTVLNPEFGKYVRDTEPETDSSLEGIDVVDIRGNEYHPNGKHVVKMYVRGDKYDDQGMVVKKAKNSERPIVRIVVVQEGDKIYSGTFAETVPKERNSDKNLRSGSFILVRGIKPRDWQGRTMWNCGDVFQSPTDEFSMNKTLFKEMVLKNPRNSPKMIKMHEEVPLTEEQRKDYKNPDRAKLSADIVEAKRESVLLCSWGTKRDDTQLIRELGKDRTIIWQEPLLGRDAISRDDLYGQKEDQNKKVSKWCRLWYKQTCSIQERGKTVNILNDIRIRGLQCAYISGMSNPEHFRDIIQSHIEKLRFAFFCNPAHEETHTMEVNNSRTKPEGLSAIDYGLVWKASSHTYVETNICWYSFREGIPVNFEFVKQSFGNVSEVKYPNTDEHNPYNKHPENGFLNLSEMSFRLEDYRDGWHFRLIADKMPNGKRMKKIKEIDDLEERAEQCSESLLNENEDDDLEIGWHLNKKYVIFALSDELVQKIEENPEEYDMTDVMANVEAVSLEYDPSVTVGSKRKEVDNTPYDSDKEDDDEDSGSKRTKRTNDMEKDDDSEDSGADRLVTGNGKTL